MDHEVDAPERARPDGVGHDRTHLLHVDVPRRNVLDALHQHDETVPVLGLAGRDASTGPRPSGDRDGTQEP